MICAGFPVGALLTAPISIILVLDQNMSNHRGIAGVLPVRVAFWSTRIHREARVQLLADAGLLTNASR